MRNFLYIFIFPLAGLLLFWPARSEAYSYRRNADIRIGQTSPRNISAFGGAFQGGASVAAADVIGDSAEEVVVGAGHGGGPQVEVYSQSGTRKSAWFAFDQKTRVGLFVSAGDLDGLGNSEIVVGPNSGREPEVIVYDGKGRKLSAFFAFEKSYTGGVRVAAIEAGPSVDGKIVTASGAGRDSEVRVYDQTGKNLYWTFSPFTKTFAGGVTVAGGWSATLKTQVLVVATGPGRSSLVRVYDLATKTLLYEWQPYTAAMKSGVWVGYKQDTIVVAPGTGGGPEVRTFSLSGESRAGYFAYEKNFRGGVMVGGVLTKDQTVAPITGPITLDDLDLVARSGKKIVISLSRQELRMYQHGKVLSTRRISTGKWSTPTPVGEFRVRNKVLVAYSKPYNLYMEYWMAFSADGSYGLHALPYWKTKNGGKLYEGAAHIGTPVSHGCVRQSIVEAKSLFEWAPVGTPVTILK